MLVPEEMALGLLLAVSGFLLVLAAVSYRRSGVRALLLTAVGLTVHVAVTLTIIVSLAATDLLEDVDLLRLVAADTLLLAFALVIGLLGGRALGRSA